MFKLPCNINNFPMYACMLLCICLCYPSTQLWTSRWQSRCVSWQTQTGCVCRWLRANVVCVRGLTGVGRGRRVGLAVLHGGGDGVGRVHRGLGGVKVRLPLSLSLSFPLSLPLSLSLSFSFSFSLPLASFSPSFSL